MEECREASVWVWKRSGDLVLQPHVPGQVTSMAAKLMGPGAGFSPKHIVYPQPFITRPFCKCVCAEPVMI